MSAACSQHRYSIGKTASPQMSTTIQKKKIPLLIVNLLLMALGCGGPFLTRMYFIHGGTRLWLSSFVETAGWPILLIPLGISYARRRPCASKRRRVTESDADLVSLSLFQSTARIAAASTALGFLTGVVCYLYAYGTSCLPVSTSGLIMSTQLAFTAVFAFLIVRQCFTPYSFNAVVLLVISAVVVALQPGGSDRPYGVSKVKYIAGFCMTVATAAVNGLIAVLVQLVFMKANRRPTYELVMEMQVVMGAAGTVFCLVGMAVQHDFQALAAEARAFGLGEAKYYMVLLFSAIFWQLLSLGSIGAIYCSSSLVAGIIGSILTPIGQLLPIYLFHETYNWRKGVSVALSFWGLASYLYGEWESTKCR